MNSSASLSAGLSGTPIRGWVVLLLNRLQLSSVVLSSFVFGIFLPFISHDLELSPLEAGLLQGVWWVTSALCVLPFGVWFSRFRPISLVLTSLCLLLPFVFLQGVAVNFLTLFLARFFTVLFHQIAVPSRPLLFQQWAAPKQYALVNAVGLSLHSLLLAVAISTSALVIAALGSWRLAYFLQGGLMFLHLIAWIAAARESKAPLKELDEALKSQQQTPLRAIKRYPQGWLIGMVMFSLSATWTSIVTFLPTLLLEDRGVALAIGGPILAFLYYGLIPGALLGGYIGRKTRNRKLLLTVPTLLNMLFALALTLIPNPWLLVLFISGIGLVWITVPAIELLPFEYPEIRPREVAVISALVLTVSGIGFAIGPIIVGAVAQFTGSIQIGLLVMSILSGVGVVAGLMYPSYQKVESSLPAKAVEK